VTRLARETANSGIYHIMLRGNERKNIFLQDEDKLRFLRRYYKKTTGNYIFFIRLLSDGQSHLFAHEGQ
jgi:putative transposase